MIIMTNKYHMNLLVIGDSISYGSELIPYEHRDYTKQSWNDWDFNVSIRPNLIEYRNHNRWSTIVGKQLNLNVINLAKPGIGNLQISSLTLSWINLNIELLTNTLVVIGWSNYNRYEFHHDDNDEWKTLYPRGNLDKDITDYYFKNLHGDLSSATNYWLQVISLQTIFNQYNIKYCMFNSINNPTKLEQFSNLVDYDTIVSQSMTDYCLSNNYKRAPGGHFLEDGNSAWADIIYSKLC